MSMVVDHQMHKHKHETASLQQKQNSKAKAILATISISLLKIPTLSCFEGFEGWIVEKNSWTSGKMHSIRDLQTLAVDTQKLVEFMKSIQFVKTWFGN